MGVVYLGQAPDRRLLAVKVVRSDRAGDPETGARFRREVRAASGVAGFCTARVLDADLDAERPYYVTEYVPGPTVQEAVDEGGPLTGGRLEALAVGVAEALEAIHAAGVVHRDLKPSNVLLSPEGPKVIDFGIARAVDATTLTQTGKVIGSVNWLAPEQLQNARASEASDVFAWGGLVTFAATGQPPFGRGDVGTIAHRILYEEPDVRGLEGRLLEAVLAALDKDPQRRPGARMLLARLVGGFGQDPVTAATQVVQSTWTMPRFPRPAAPPAADQPATVPVAPMGSMGPVGAAGGAGPAWPAQDQTPRLAPAPASWATAPVTPVAPVGAEAPGAPGAPGAPEAAGAASPLAAGWEAGHRWSQDGRDIATEVGRYEPDEREQAEERAAPRTYPRGTVLADLLPGGLLRDLTLVATFAAVNYATLTIDEPVSSARITVPALVVLGGAALLGCNRAGGGFVLGAVGVYTLGHNPLPSLRTTLGYLMLLLAIGLVGTLAAFGRRHKTIGAIIALVVGFALMQAALAAIGWDTFHLPRPPDLNPLNLSR
jgi:serine/threonine kinase PknH